MLKTLEVSNFRSMGPNVRFELGSLTALVGPNGAGKSNITDVIRFVSDALTLGLEGAIASRHGIHAVRRWSSGRPFDVHVRISSCDSRHEGIYQFTLAGHNAEAYSVKEETAVVRDLISGIQTQFILRKGVWVQGPTDLRPKVTEQSLAMTLVAGDQRFAPLADALRNVCVYSIFPDTLREPQKPDTTRPMKQHGQNWTSILQSLGSNGAAVDLKAALARLTGDITDFRVRQLGGYLNAEFLHQTGRKRTKDRQKWFESAQESDGTLRVAGIISALLQDPAPTLIGIEEPELTVHVGAIPLLFDYLRQASRNGQVLVTTHSVELLELLDVDEIRVVERRDGITTVAPVRQEQRDAIKSRLLTVGDVVGMEGGLKQQELDINLPEPESMPEPI
jgi:predicted ATPase